MIEPERRSSMIPASILVVDDEPSMSRYLRTLLQVDAYRVETTASGSEALERLQREPAPDLVLLDVLMPGMDGLRTLERLRQLRPAQRVIMVSCVSDPRHVVQAIRLGACDYLTKPFRKQELDQVVRRCLRTPAGPTALGSEVEEVSDGLYFVAVSPAMRKIQARAAQVAKVDVPVLLLGESGSGKEVLARLIHKLSPRAHRSFLKVNCAALPADLLESELFGYEQGAFTGATRAKPGKFELCSKGTILLDEIAEMPPALQAKLLQVLQDRQFSRLGGRSTITVDVRILAATNVDVRKAIASKKLREDLYYRLNTFTLELPPLRARKEEIPLLLQHFMTLLAESYARQPLPVSPSLVEACMGYEWPGNLRELENLVKRYLILGDEALVLSELKPASGIEDVKPEPAPKSPEAPPGGLKSLVRNLKDAAEMEAITRALEQTNWRRQEAARLLKISYKALRYKVRQYGIKRS